MHLRLRVKLNVFPIYIFVLRVLSGVSTRVSIAFSVGELGTSKNNSYRGNGLAEGIEEALKNASSEVIQKYCVKK